MIVTNAHVVAGATTISVMLRDGTTYPATAIGTDETNDLAVLKVEGERTSPSPRSATPTTSLVGEWAIAIGNPYGFMLGNSEPSVTAGVISGVGRNLVARGEGPSAYFDMIQTDASINPGQLGRSARQRRRRGDRRQLVDLLARAAARSVSASPFRSIARGASPRISLAHGRVRRPWIGVRLEQPRTDNPRDLIARGAHGRRA